MRRSRFEQLVADNSRAVATYARALTNDPWTADDAVQETFLRAWKYQDSFRGDGSYEGWLIRICRNVVIDLGTKRGSERLDVVPFQPGADPWATDVDHEAAFDLDEALRELPIAQREIITLCGVLGYDYESAAVLLDLPIGTVRSRLNRARKQLATDLDRGRLDRGRLDQKADTA